MRETVTESTVLSFVIRFRRPNVDALERLAHATTNKGRLLASPLQAFVGLRDSIKRSGPPNHTGDDNPFDIVFPR